MAIVYEWQLASSGDCGGTYEFWINYRTNTTTGVTTPYRSALLIDGSVTSTPWKSLNVAVDNLYFRSSGTSICDNAFKGEPLTNSYSDLSAIGFYDATPYIITIPHGFTTIGDYAFCYSETGSNPTVPLYDINLPSTLASVGEYAFAGRWARGITQDISGAGISSLGKYAFAWVHCIGNNYELSIKLNLTEIPERAFFEASGKSGYTSVPVKLHNVQTITKINDYGLNTYFPEGSDIIDFEQVLYFGKRCLPTYDDSDTLASFTLNPDATYLGPACFSNLKATVVNLPTPNVLRSIGDYYDPEDGSIALGPFYYNTYIKRLIIDPGWLGAGSLTTFANMTNLEHAYVPYHFYCGSSYNAFYNSGPHGLLVIDNYQGYDLYNTLPVDPWHWAGSVHYLRTQNTGRKATWYRKKNGTVYKMRFFKKTGTNEVKEMVMYVK